MPMIAREELDNGRDEALATLQDHFANDRLSLEDFEERTEGVERAPSLEAIDAILADLPRVDGEGRRVITPPPEDTPHTEADEVDEVDAPVAHNSKRWWQFWR